MTDKVPIILKWPILADTDCPDVELSELKEENLLGPLLPFEEKIALMSRKRQICEKFRCFKDANRMYHHVIKGASQDGSQASNGSLPTSSTSSQGGVLFNTTLMATFLLPFLSPPHVLLTSKSSLVCLTFLSANLPHFLSHLSSILSTPPSLHHPLSPPTSSLNSFLSPPDLPLCVCPSHFLSLHH